MVLQNSNRLADGNDGIPLDANLLDKGVSYGVGEHGCVGSNSAP
jgi:hypothetical protein